MSVYLNADFILFYLLYTRHKIDCLRCKRSKTSQRLRKTTETSRQPVKSNAPAFLIKIRRPVY